MESALDGSALGLKKPSELPAWAKGLAVGLLAIVSLAAFSGSLLIVGHKAASVISAGCNLLPGLRPCSR
jgi:hypothetical protein